MPIEALRSVEEHFERILRHVMPKRLAAELKVGDKGFYFRYFKGYRPDKIGRGRIKQIAKKEVFKDPGNELFANLMIVHWNESHGPLYREMVTHVRTINEDVEAIETIEDATAHTIIDDLLTRHDREDVLICVRLNGVRFTAEAVESRLVRGEDAPEPGAAPAEEAAAPEAEKDPKAKAPKADKAPKAKAAKAEKDPKAKAAKPEKDPKAKAPKAAKADKAPKAKTPKPAKADSDEATTDSSSEG